MALAKGELHVFVEAHYASSFFRTVSGVEQFSVPGVLVATDLAQPGPVFYALSGWYNDLPISGPVPLSVLYVGHPRGAY